MSGNTDTDEARRHAMLAGLALAAAASILPASSIAQTGPPAGAPSPFKVSILKGNALSYVPIVAQQTGIWARHGLAVEFVSVATGPAFISSVQSGSADGGPSAFTLALPAQQRGGKRLVAIAGDVGVASYTIAVRPGLEDKIKGDWRQVAQALKGTKFGVPALGGFLIVLIGPAGVYYLMGILILIAVAGLIPVTKHVMSPEDIEEARVLAVAAGTDETPRNLPASAHGGGGGARGLSDIRDGIRYMRGDPVVLALLWINFFIVLMSMPYMQMLAGFVKEVLHGGPEQIGFLISATGIGALAGSLVVASMPNRGRGKVFLVSALILGIALVGFVISTSLWLTAVIMLAVGFGQAGRMSLGSILIMSYTKPEFQGRVMSVYMMEFSLVSFGTFAVGILGEMVGIQWAIGSTAAALVLVSIYGLLLMPRVRDLP